MGGKFLMCIDFFILAHQQPTFSPSPLRRSLQGNPDAILMNGRAITKKCETPANMTNVTAPGCLDGCASDPLNQLMNIKVETGKVYLLRFICATR